MKPKLSRSDVESLLRAKGVTDKVALVGVRGYYLDSMGKPGANDRGVYDDAIFIVSPTRCEAFQANTDPSVFRKGIATLSAGVHRYYKGKHKNRYWALRLVGEQATVTRDGQTGDKIGIALNIHKGGVRTTGSEGCQTLKPADWDDFIEIVYDEMDDHKQKSIPYLLVDEIERRTADDTAIEPPRGIPAANSPQSVKSEKTAIHLAETDSAAAHPPTADAPDVVQNTAQVKIESGESVPKPEEILPGTRPTDEPAQVSQGGILSRWLTAAGGLGGATVAVKGFFADNENLIIVGIACGTLLILALIFRTVILDWLRMQLFSDPKRYNVK